MKLRKTFVVGLIILVVGVIIALAGPALMVKREVWVPKSSGLYEDSVATVYARWTYCYPTYPLPMIIEAKDFRIEGNIVEVTGLWFDFYVFNVTNYELWKAGYPYAAYVEVRNVTLHSFSFHPTKDDYGDLRFVVENKGDDDITTKLSAVLKWSEKEVIEPPVAAETLFALGAFIGLIGLMLIIIAVAAKHVLKPREAVN